MTNNYTEAIAAAARELKRTDMEESVFRTEARREASRRAREKLYWMIDAEKHGWNVADYRPED